MDVKDGIGFQYFTSRTVSDLVVVTYDKKSVKIINSRRKKIDSNSV